MHTWTFLQVTPPHTSLGQLTQAQLFAEKLSWLLHETSSCFQLCLPMPGGGCLLLGRQGGMQSPSMPPPRGAPPGLSGLTCPTEPFWLQTF